MSQAAVDLVIIDHLGCRFFSMECTSWNPGMSCIQVTSPTLPYKECQFICSPFMFPELVTSDGELVMLTRVLGVVSLRRCIVSLAAKYQGFDWNEKSHEQRKGVGHTQRICAATSSDAA